MSVPINYVNHVVDPASDGTLYPPEVEQKECEYRGHTFPVGATILQENEKIYQCSETGHWVVLDEHPDHIPHNPSETPVE